MRLLRRCWREGVDEVGVEVAVGSFCVETVPGYVTLDGLFPRGAQ